MDQELPQLQIQIAVIDLGLIKVGKINLMQKIERENLKFSEDFLLSIGSRYPRNTADAGQLHIEV